MKMSSKTILKIFGGSVVAIILWYSMLPGEQLPFEETVIIHREEILDFMKHSEESPLPDSLKSNFNGFDYFAPDPSFKVSASLERISEQLELNMTTNDGKAQVYTKYGYASFELFGQQHRLTLLQASSAAEDGALFLPFGDNTNGESTYGGGRYLDLEFTKRNTITIDFNLAYNPYCAYSASYSCPLPPAENQLTVAINAGEKNFD